MDALEKSHALRLVRDTAALRFIPGLTRAEEAAAKAAGFRSGAGKMTFVAAFTIAVDLSASWLRAITAARLRTATTLGTRTIWRIPALWPGTELRTARWWAFKEFWP